MIRLFQFSFICMLLCLTLVLSAEAQSPFRAPSTAQSMTETQEAGWFSAVLSKINQWQRQLKQEMVTLSREVKESGDLAPLFTLLALAFIYGVVHAAGPGHGKAVTLGYVLTQGRLAPGLVMGNLVAIVHGVSGVALVLIVSQVLKASIRGALDQFTEIVQAVSYGLITLLGLVLLVGALRSWHQSRGQTETDPSSLGVPPWLMALAAGAVPCPGVVLLMLFCLSMNMIWLGVALAMAMSLGMGVTISAVGLLAYAGKGTSLRLTRKHPTVFVSLQNIFQVLAALGVTTLGALLLSSVLWGAG